MFNVITVVFYTLFLIVCAVGLVSCGVFTYRIYKSNKKFKYMTSLDEMKERDDATGNFRVRLTPAEHTMLSYWISLDNDKKSIHKVVEKFYLSPDEERRFIEILFQYKEVRLRIFDMEIEWECDRYGEKLYYDDRRNIVDQWMSLIYDFNIDEIDSITRHCARCCPDINNLYYFGIDYYLGVVS